jgi:hypothetical protein
MRQRVLLSTAGALALGAGSFLGVAAFGDSPANHAREDLLRAPLVGSQTTDPPLFGESPGGAPWVISRGSVRVRGDGRLEAEVRGLVIPGVGTGPVTTLSASLACNGTVVDSTKSVPLSKAGDARIRDGLTVPSRCIAPVVFLNPNGSTTVYIGIDGRQL